MRSVRTRIRRLHALERGDGETYGFTAATPVLFSLLAFGITIAAIGFGRIGASSAAERGAYAAATRSEGFAVGSSIAASFFSGWSGSAGIGAGVSAGDKSVRITIGRTTSFGGPLQGSFSSTQLGAMQKRSERFYPGGGE
jgi:hypothetical protein